MRYRQTAILIGLVTILSAPFVAGSSGLPGAADAWAKPKKVDNPHGKYKEDCSMCHGAEGWKPARISKRFDHEKFLPLSGAHASVACMGCHKSLDFSMASSACLDCHSDVHNGELGTDCSRCHGTRSFNDREDQIRLHRVTRFPLGGAHATLDCEMCHQHEAPGKMSWVNTATECESCHMKDFMATTSPNHDASGFSHDCTQCHDDRAWGDAHFNHAATNFPLTGAHSALACDVCHKGGTYTGLSTACVSCHQSDYNSTAAPAHAAAGFSTDCLQCHNTVRWQDAHFDHAATSFPLTGAHVTVACDGCHTGGTYTGLSTACVSCHQSDYNSTTDPAHAAAGFPTDCVQCHTTIRWQGAQFNHSLTNFPLTGAHVSVACDGCHAGGVYTGLATACISCHQNDYNSTTDPNHAAAGFPTDCVQCHTTTRWQGASFNHSLTNFPLTGAHLAVACDGCHTGGTYNGLSTACVSCHQNDYNSTRDPNHQTAGFSTDCVQCHSTTQWQGAQFNHSLTNFPLTGAHVAVACDGCHASGVYSGLATACVSCHQNDYNNVTDPNHQAAGFPTDCAQCHTTTQWTGAQFDHTQWFPIYTGTHRNKWTRCGDCHTSAVNFAQFNCLGCHPHSDKAQTDSHHQGRNGYSYESNACYSCHPNGRAG